MVEPLSSQFSCKQTYLNSATAGLACDASVEAMRTDLSRWADGQLDPIEYDHVVNRCRELFASFVGASSDEVSIANQAATSIGLLAASLPSGARVLAVEEDFTSVLFPLMAQQSRGVEVTLVPFEELVESVSPEFDWVVCSIVQSSNGKVADLAGLSAAAKAADCRILLDGTQSVGWMPVDRQHWDVLVCGAYKWLLSPRGTAFMAIKPDLMDDVTPINANWYAGESPWDSIYGSPLRLATSARRFDISPAWINWVGTLPALELIASLGVDSIHRHNVGLGNDFCQRLGLPPSNSAIVSLSGIEDTQGLKDAGIAASIRGGSLRLSFHLYNGEKDVDAVVSAIT